MATPQRVWSKVGIALITEPAANASEAANGARCRHATGSVTAGMSSVATDRAVEREPEAEDRQSRGEREIGPVAEHQARC